MEPLSFLVGLILGILGVSLLAFHLIRKYKKAVAAEAESRAKAEQAYLLMRGALVNSECEKERLKEENRAMVCQKLKAWGVPDRI